MLFRSDGRDVGILHRAFFLGNAGLNVVVYLLQDKGRFYMIHRPFRLTEILTKMHEYKIEPKRIQFIHPYIDKEPTMVLVEGMRGAKPRVTIEPPIIMYTKDGTLLQKNGNNSEKQR